MARARVRWVGRGRAVVHGPQAADGARHDRLLAHHLRAVRSAPTQRVYAPCAKPRGAPRIPPIPRGPAAPRSRCLEARGAIDASFAASLARRSLAASSRSSALSGRRCVVRISSLDQPLQHGAPHHGRPRGRAGRPRGSVRGAQERRDGARLCAQQAPFGVFGSVWQRYGRSGCGQAAVRRAVGSCGVRGCKKTRCQKLLMSRMIAIYTFRGLSVQSDNQA